MYNLHKQSLIHQGYEPLGLLGEGSFSSVYTVRNLKTNKLQAVKIIENYLSLLCNKTIETECNTKNTQCSDKIRKNNFKYFNREVAILKRLIQSYHPSIVKILNIKQTFLYSYIYMEHLNNGNLRDFLNKNGPLKPNEILAKLWIYQLASALDYLHSIGIAHRDIKLQNIGLNDKMNVKLIDFGFACKCLLNKSKIELDKENILFRKELIDFVNSIETIDKQKSIFNSCLNQKNDNNSLHEQIIQFSMSQCGTPLFIAPEIIIADKCPYDPSKADIWSLGVSMFAIVSHRYPFTKKDYKLLYRQQIKRFWIKKRVYSCFSYDAFDLLIKMLNPIPKKRLQASDILKHDWIIKSLKEILILQNQNISFKYEYLQPKNLEFSTKTNDSNMNVI